MAKWGTYPPDEQLRLKRDAAEEIIETLEEARLIVANLGHDESLFLAKIDSAIAKAKGEA